MTWTQDRQNRRYAAFLAGICLALAAVFLICWVKQEVRIRDSIFLWERAAASSLLEQGFRKGQWRLRLKIQRRLRQERSSCARSGTQKKTGAFCLLSWREMGGEALSLGRRRPGNMYFILGRNPLLSAEARTGV